jgi:NSS family neurotransmitter:Na+ symporter
MVTNSSARETFGSRFGSTMTLIGVAVGLANIWRFPYMTGKFGGAAFVAVYLVFAFLLGIPAIMAEWTLGRHTRQGPAGAFTAAGMPGGKAVGGLLFFTVFMASSYYILIIGQVLFYWGATVLGSSAGQDPAGFFDRYLGGITFWNVFTTFFTFVAIAGVLYFGVRRGIEKVSRIVMPIVFISLLVVIVRSVTLPGAMEGVRFFLLPDFSKLTPQTMLAALGQVFFSMSLGGTFFLLYGSYLREKEDIPRTAVATAMGDLTAAILGGLAILPAVFSLGLEPSSGPSLIFITLPGVFEQIPGGRIVGGIFFGALFFAAYLSAIAAIEVLVDGLKVYLNWSRARSLTVLVIAETLLSLPAMASSDYLMFSDLIWGSTMQPVGSALTLIALGWFIGRGKALEEVNRGSSVRIGSFWIIWIRYVIPTVIVVILIYGWWGPLQNLLSKMFG